ncbi:LacI family DNA-binding transcriptional regulator [Tessaracoccus coleopterorum]|uniref:LacI family DNA-binding transcriptional regulator n=1 Tax=Tessaracoccus coleopterorum TaxID=2714950 RepID=UPI0018D4108F
MARLSMREVAALAQVSVGTVSNVLNNPDLVSPRRGHACRAPSTSSVGCPTGRRSSCAPAAAARSGWP